MGFLADLKEKVESLEAAHGMSGKDRQQGLLVMPIDNRDIKVEAATGGLMSPREGYGVGSLATKGIMRALQKRAKAKKEYAATKSEDIDDRIPPSDTIEDYIVKPVDPIKDPLSREGREETLEARKSMLGPPQRGDLSDEDLALESLEDGVFEALWMDNTVPFEERWNFVDRIISENEYKFHPDDTEFAIREGVRRFLSEVDEDYADAVANNLYDERTEIENNLFEDVINEIVAAEGYDFSSKGKNLPNFRTKNQEGGSLMSSREGYGFGSIATKFAKKVAKKLGKSADEAWNSSAKKQEFVQKAVNSLTDEDKTRIERKEYGLISHYGDKLDIEQFSRPGIERHKETILWNSGGDMKQYEKYLDTYIEMMQEGERFGKQEGGEMAMPPELMEQDVPVDTYPNMTPEEEAMPIASDEQMQEDYVDYVTAEVLTTSEQDYLNAALDNDPQLESILDKVVTYATEFTGEGEVEGPGTGISDSIPARLSDGEFVITKKATDQIGADNLQTMMDEAERAADGGMMQKYALGGAVDNTMLGGAVKDTTPLMDEKTEMYGTTRQDDEMKKQMMYANRMPSIIGR